MDAKTVKWFEQEQRQYGTAIALDNFVITLATDQLKLAGISGVTLRDRKESREHLRKER